MSSNCVPRRLLAAPSRLFRSYLSCTHISLKIQSTKKSQTPHAEVLDTDAPWHQRVYAQQEVIRRRFAEARLQSTRNFQNPFLHIGVCPKRRYTTCSSNLTSHRAAIGNRHLQLLTKTFLLQSQMYCQILCYREVT